MMGIVALYFTKEFFSEVDPISLLLGASIGILVVVILIKKIVNKRIKK